MNDRQRDLFLWQWSRRRAPGRAKVALRGAGIGALGGILFGLMLSPGSAPGVPAYDLLGQLASGVRVYVLAIPTFAALGWSGARRVYTAQEAMYQRILASGAPVPERKPVLQTRDRGPAVAVGVAVVLIVAFILYVVIRYG